MNSKPVTDQPEISEDEIDVFITDEELEAYISRLEEELGIPRAEFLKLVSIGKEPDTFAAMALKDLLLYR